MKKKKECIFLLSLSVAILISGCRPAEKPPSPGDVFSNSIGMKFVLIPAGTFMMGSPPEEPTRKPDEIQHKVTISKPFFMQTTEVTQEVWKKVMGYNLSVFKNCGENCPVPGLALHSSWHILCSCFYRVIFLHLQSSTE